MPYAYFERRPAPSLWGPGIAAGVAAGGFSMAALAFHSHLETGSAAAGLNAPSQWLWGEEALRANGWSMRHTGVGVLTHQAAGIFWGCLHAARAHSREHPLAEAVLSTAIVAFVDFALTPRRLTPGFERRLSPNALAWIFGAFALGLATLPSGGRLRD